MPGYNLWPLRLVTRLFELAKNGPASGARAVIQKILPSSNSSKQPEHDDPFCLSLHTRTPVQAVISSKPDTGCRWSVQTQRGSIDTDYVVYATNAYTSHLLPQFTGPNGIVPVRGQVIAIRAKVGYTDEGWPESGENRGLSRSGWVGNEGFEYWFPRPHPAVNYPNASSLKAESGGGPIQPRKPLVIIGGGRETLKDQGYATYDTDDSIIDPQVSTTLKEFLGTIFPGQFPSVLHTAESNPDNVIDLKGIEIEWVSLALPLYRIPCSKATQSGIMGFTKSEDPLVGRLCKLGGFLTTLI
jgi:glycine/D-amino acid oxidase-like deaminating enzyme